MIRRNTQLVFLGGLLFAVASMTGCKSESAPKAPQKDDSLNDGDNAQEDGNDDNDADAQVNTSTNTNTSTDTTPLSLSVSDATALNVKIGTPVSVTFNLAGATGKTILVGMMESPSGSTVSVSGTSVTFSWASPTGGTYPLKFLLRDQAACQAAETDDTQCAISATTTGLVAKSYDVASQEFSLVVSTDDTLGLPGTGAGNDQLIQQIIALLGGNGGGGGAIATLLQGLGGAQLQQILSQLQSGGGGGGITQLIGLLGGL